MMVMVMVVVVEAAVVVEVAVIIAPIMSPFMTCLYQMISVVVPLSLTVLQLFAVQAESLFCWFLQLIDI